MNWKRKVKPRVPCPYCGKKHYHIADAFNCADLNVKEAINKERKLIKIEK
jgi:hypothetical protein